MIAYQVLSASTCSIPTPPEAHVAAKPNTTEVVRPAVAAVSAASCHTKVDLDAVRHQAAKGYVTSCHQLLRQGLGIAGGQQGTVRLQTAWL